MNDVRMPALYIGHGAPPLLDDPVRSGQLAAWAADLPRPKAILIISAHWESAPVSLSASGAPLVYDFGGFDARYYRMTYETPDATALAQRIAAMMPASEPVHQHASRGLDHGAWVPLTAMFPQAQLPVAQLSVARQSPAAHFAIGRALTPLRDEGVLILASGAITHNFDWIDWRAADAPPLPQALVFADWVADRLAAGDAAALLDYRRSADGATAHPTEEHLLPLFVAMGAGGAPLARHRPPFAYGGLAMDAYVWN